MSDRAYNPLTGRYVVTAVQDAGRDLEAPRYFEKRTDMTYENFPTTLRFACRHIRVDSHQQASIAVLTQLGEMTSWQLDGSLDAPIGELAKAGGLDFDNALDALRTLREAGLVHPEQLAVEWPAVIRSLSAYNQRELWDGSCREARKWIDEVLAESSRNDSLVPPAVQFQVDLSGTTYDQDVELGKKLVSASEKIQFALGDFLLQAAAKHGTRYTDLIDDLGIKHALAKNLASVAGKFKESRRQDSLSYSHHAEVAPLPEEKQDELLQRAVTENLSVRAVRAEVRSIKAVEKPAPAPQPQPQPEAPRLPAPAVTVVSDDSAPVGTAAIDPPEDQQTTSTLEMTQEERARRILADFDLLDEDHQREIRAQLKDDGELHPAAVRLDELLTPDSDGKYGSQQDIADMLGDILSDLYFDGPLCTFAPLGKILAELVAGLSIDSGDVVDLLDGIMDGLEDQVEHADELGREETHEFVAEIGDAVLQMARTIAGRSDFHLDEQSRTKYIIAQLKEYHWLAAPHYALVAKGSDLTETTSGCLDYLVATTDCDGTEESKAELHDRVLAVGRGVVASLRDIGSRVELFADPDEQYRFCSRVILPMITTRNSSTKAHLAAKASA